MGVDAYPGSTMGSEGNTDDDDPKTVKRNPKRTISLKDSDKFPSVREEELVHLERRSSRMSGRPQRSRARTSLRTSEGTRIRVKTACTNCKLAKARCDNGRPCSRCVKRGCESTCVDAVPKRRGRKRNHEGGAGKLNTSKVEEEADNTVEDHVEEQGREGQDQDQGFEGTDSEREIQPEIKIVMKPSKTRAPKSKKRKAFISSKRLDFLQEKDTIGDIDLECFEKVEDEEQKAESEEQLEIGQKNSLFQEEQHGSGTIFNLIEQEHAETPALLVQSPNNTLSDLEFNALLAEKHGIEHSTPQFAPKYPSAEIDANVLTRFNLAAGPMMGMSGESYMAPSISSSPFPLNALWSDINQPPPAFSSSKGIFS